MSETKWDSHEAMTKLYEDLYFLDPHLREQRAGMIILDAIDKAHAAGAASVQPKGKDEIKDVVAKVSKNRYQYIETLAGAFLSETGIEPTAAELIETHNKDTITWSFRRKPKEESK